MKTFFDLINKVKDNLYTNNFFAVMQNGSINQISYKLFFENIEGLASFLILAGVKKSDKIIIMMDSSPSWLMCDLSIIKAGGIVAPMFANLSFDNIVYQFQNCEADYIFIQDEDVFNLIKKSEYKFKQIITLKKFSQEFLERNRDYPIVSFEDAVKEGMVKKNLTALKQKEVEDNVSPNDTATIIYTSGTSGRPKGVELSHNNIISQMEAIDSGYSHIIEPSDSIFSFLPLAHIFQRTVTYYFLSKSLTFYFSNDIKSIVSDLAIVKPSIIAVVPRFLEKIKNSLNEKIKNEPSFVKRIIGKLCYSYAVKHEPQSVHCPLFFLFDKLMYAKVREKLGGNIKAMICGGAALPDEVYRFFLNLGIPLYQGYGLTETSPVVAVNTPAHNRPYTIGKPLPGVEIKIMEDRELKVKGPNVMKGYFKADDEGGRVIDENGFLATGDLAEMDEDGYLTIIGRKKEQFKTSNGKFINPIKIENLLNAIPFIETSCVIAENKPFVTVILFPNEVGVTRIHDVEISLPAYIRQINEQLDRHEHIHYFHLCPKQASIENGQITPSMKVVRNAIIAQFKDVIIDFYQRTN